jgi:hypothetical protein
VGNLADAIGLLLGEDGPLPEGDNLALLLLLDLVVLSGRECGEVAAGDAGGQRVELVQHLLDVQQEALRKGAAEVLADDHAEHRHVLRIGGHGVRRHDPPEAAQEVGDLELIVPAAVLEGEGHQRHAVVLGHDVEAARLLQALLQHHRVLLAVLHDVLIPLRIVQARSEERIHSVLLRIHSLHKMSNELMRFIYLIAKADQLVVLCNDLAGP